MTDQTAGNLRIELDPLEELERAKRWEKHWINFERDTNPPKTEELVVFNSLKHSKERYKRA